MRSCIRIRWRLLNRSLTPDPSPEASPPTPLQKPHPLPLSKGEGSDYRQGVGDSERALALQRNKGHSGYFPLVGYESSYLIPYNNNHIQRLRTAARAAPCNKSAMTDNSYPSHKMGAKPVHGIQSVFSWHLISVRMASNHCSHGIKSVFVWHQISVFTGSKQWACEVETMLSTL